MMNTHLALILESTPAEIIPKETRAAIEFEDAAKKLLAEQEDNTDVDLTTATKPADLPRVLEAALAKTANRERAVQIARQLVQIAADRLESAWAQGSAQVMGHFADRFNTLANELVEAVKGTPDAHTLITQHWDPDGQKLMRIVGELEHLSHIRDAYAHSSGTLEEFPVSIPYEKASRTAIFDSALVEQDFRYRVNNRGWNYWVTLADFPGAQIKWQTREDQLAQPEPARNLRAKARIAESYAPLIKPAA